MRLTVNGEIHDLNGLVTLGELLQAMNISTEKLAVELNGEVLNPEQYEITKLNEGDRLELVRFVGGG